MGTTSSTKLRDVTDDRVTDTGWYGVTETTPKQQALRGIVTVRSPMNSAGALTLESLDGRRTFQVVDHATPEIQAVLSRVERATRISVELVKLTARGDLWRAVGVHPDSTRP